MAQNEPPEIPSFKPKTDQEKKGAGAPLSSLAKPATPGAAPAAPGASPSSALPSFSKGSSGSGLWPNLAKGGSPKLRVRGLPGGATLVERLKNLRKKDLMFIGAGLSVLLMAPLAEHFMMTPQQDQGTLDAGFDRKGPLFQDGTSIYESGTGGFSPGGLVGSGTDVITPLNVRDPAALVMGPGATQKPAATVTPPPPTTDAQPEKPSWKDALAQAANKGASAGISKAKPAAFKPDGKLAGALRGLSALSGASAGGGPSMKLDKLDASGVPNRARDSNSLSRTQAMPGYKGVASRSPSSGGGPESLKAAGQRQGDIFNKGNATGALDTAARTGVPGGGAGAGGGSPGDGDPSKNPSGSSNKDSKSLGESLALLRAKLEMQKALDLKWKKKEWKEFGRKKMIEEQVYKLAIENLLGKGIFEPVGKAIGKSLSQMLPGGEKYMACVRPVSGEPFVVPMSQVGDEYDKDSLYFMKGSNLMRGTDLWGEKCSESGAGTPKNDRGRRERSTGNLDEHEHGSGAQGDQATSSEDVDSMRAAGNRIDEALKKIGEAQAAINGVTVAWDKKAEWAQVMGHSKNGVQKLITARDQLTAARDKTKSSLEKTGSALGGDRAVAERASKLASDAGGILNQLATDLKKDPIAVTTTKKDFQDKVSTPADAQTTAATPAGEFGKAGTNKTGARADIDAAAGKVTDGKGSIEAADKDYQEAVKARDALNMAQGVATPDQATGAVDKALGAVEALMSANTHTAGVARTVEKAQQEGEKAVKAMETAHDTTEPAVAASRKDTANGAVPKTDAVYTEAEAAAPTGKYNGRKPVDTVATPATEVLKTDVETFVTTNIGEARRLMTGEMGDAPKGQAAYTQQQREATTKESVQGKADAALVKIDEAEKVLGKPPAPKTPAAPQPAP